MFSFINYLESACILPLKLNILDLIIFDKDITKWIYTDRNSLVQFRYLDYEARENVIRCFIKNINSYNASDVII